MKLRGWRLSFAVMGFALLQGAAAQAGTIFYVDSTAGNDANSGTNPSVAWATLKNVNEHTFQPGDSILLRAGQSWVGTIAPKGSGSAEAPIVLGRFGEGAKPLVKGNGAAQTLFLSEVSYWTVEDIAITNHGEHVGERNGIELHVAYKELSTGLHLVRVDVSDVNGEVGSKSSGGIGVMAWGKNGHGARFDDLLIDHCTVEHVDGQGIWFHVKGSRDEDEDTSHDYPNTRVRVTGTTIMDTGRNAIFLRDSLNASIDNNVVRFASARTHGNAVVVAGTKGTVIRNNEVSNTGTAGGGENGAFDADDGAVDTLIEYNWTHDNLGGSANIVNDPRKHSVNSGTVVRYNVSENDKNSVFGIGGGAITNTMIYNNTVFIGKGLSPKILQAGRFVSHVPGDPDGIIFANNVIYSEGGGEYPISASHVVIDSNCYFGKGSVVIKQDQHREVGDPGFDRSGLPATSWKELEHYRLRKDAGCGRAAAVNIPGHGDLNVLGKNNSGDVRGAAGLAQ